MTLSLAFAIVGLVVIVIVASREHAKVIASRRTLLDRCAPLLSDVRLDHGGDGFPMLQGRYGAHIVRVELIPDSMTIRRLPQLWLKVTRLEVRPRLAEFSVLVRPSGTEFYSLTSAHPFVLDPPAGIGSEVIAKGNRAASQRVLDVAAPVLQDLFDDPRMKEVAVTARGMRIIWQVSEGQRGEHLLFRQCRFESAGVECAVLAGLLANLDELASSLDRMNEVQAA